VPNLHVWQPTGAVEELDTTLLDDCATLLEYFCWLMEELDAVLFEDSVFLTEELDAVLLDETVFRTDELDLA